LFAASLALAQDYEVVHAFSGADGQPSGRLLLQPDGSLLGTASRDGECGLGSVFVLRPGKGRDFQYEELHTFCGLDGSLPSGNLTLGPDGFWYGTTYSGGPSDQGTVFKVDSHGRLTTVHAFDGGEAGQNPGPELLFANDGFLYGAAGGGLDGAGFLFRIDAQGSYSVFHAFDWSDGAGPNTPLIQALDGNFYGTTGGGPAGHGPLDGSTIFRIDPAGTLTTLHVTTESEGVLILAGLLQASDGLFYGTASSGGDFSGGTAFRIDAAGHFTKLHDFGSGPIWDNPVAPLMQASDGNIYGTTAGSFNPGALFRIDPAGNLSLVRTFVSASDGSNSAAALIEGPGGKLYGTLTQAGPGPSWGTVFSLAFDAEFSVVWAFPVATAGVTTAGVVEGTDGNHYGLTTVGGPSIAGSVFVIDQTDRTSFLADLDPVVDGAQPRDSLLLGLDGSFYGTATNGGQHDLGTVFRFNPSEGLVPLHSFGGAAPDGKNPIWGLLQADDGNFYGSTDFGGAFGGGTVYRVNGSSGDVTTIYSLQFGTDGKWSQGRVQGADGKLYGITLKEGPLGAGTAFRLNLDGTQFEKLHDFQASTDGSQPTGFLTEANGFFYGTAWLDGPNAAGTVFKMDAGGSVSVVHAFSGTDGSGPYGGVIRGSDGDFYGITLQGGAFGFGTLFRLSDAGSLTTLVNFDGVNGSVPAARLSFASDGTLYGTTQLGGAGGRGVVFRRTLAAVSPVFGGIVPSSGPASGRSAVRLGGAHLSPYAQVAFGGVPASTRSIDVLTLRTVSPALAAGRLYDVTVTNPSGGVGSLVAGWFADFLDVPSTQAFHDVIETLVRSGITAGCGGGNYCPDSAVNRAQAAVFLLKAEHGSDYVPPKCTGLFSDVSCPSLFADWIEQLALEGITAGCDDTRYCPDDPVTREQAAVFLLKTEHGTGYVPPACANLFEDVACPSLFADWIERLYAENITTGCSLDPLLFCPASSNTRGQIAAFLTKTFALP